MNIPLDKQAHFFSGAVIALALGYFVAPWIAFVAAFTAGVAKEVYDRFHPERHTVDAADFWATALGGAAGSLIVFAGAGSRI